MKNIIVALLLIFNVNLLLAQVPHTISYQGLLTDSNGNPVSDGNYKLTFRLSPSPSNTISLWEETHESVPVTNGIFHVILGSIDTLKLPFDRQYYLEISINDGDILQPLTELTSVPYSLNVADSAAVKSLNERAGKITLKAGNNISISTNEDTITISSGGDGGSLTLPFNGIVSDDIFAFRIRNNGNGVGIASEVSSFNPAITAVNEGDGAAGSFSNSDPASTSPTLNATSNGKGNTTQSINTGTDGYAGYFVNTNSATSKSSLFADNKGQGKAAIEATNSGGVGYAGLFIINDPDFIGSALLAQNEAKGSALEGVSAGEGAAVEAIAISSGTAVKASRYASAGTGMVAEFEDPATDNTEPAVYIKASSDVLAVPALKVEHNGRGTAGRFEVTDVNGPGNAVVGINSGIGIGVQGETKGSGINSFGVWALASASSSATPLKVTQSGSGNDIAIFQAQNVNVARIDKTGKGFFNGGTQTGGADIAEAFEVEGSKLNYEPGDVLIISQKSNRTVELSSKPYSRLVAGVYATKPGVLLTEKDINSGDLDHVPMGVIGVLPTKVTTENGNIKRGDLLVTSSIPGYAMKGTNRELMFGSVIGKALENFDGSTGVIKVLVNVK